MPTAEAPTAPPQQATETPSLPLRLQALLEETLIPNAGSVELSRDPVQDYLGRFTTRTPHIAELFVENTKLVPASEANCALDEAMLESVLQWYRETAYQPADGDVDMDAASRMGVCQPLADLDRPSGPLLRAMLEDPLTARLLYGIDIFAITDSMAMRVLPGTDVAWLVRTLRPDDRAALQRTIVGPRAGAVSARMDLLALIGVPWRYMVLQGPRGARRLWSDVGRLLTGLEGCASSLGVDVQAELDFLDDAVNDALLLDGVERSAFALMTVQEG